MGAGLPEVEDGEEEDDEGALPVVVVVFEVVLVVPLVVEVVPEVVVDLTVVVDGLGGGAM